MKPIISPLLAALCGGWCTPLLCGEEPIPPDPNDCDGCGTVVPGGTISNETWTSAGSPYCVQATVFIDDLNIEAGVCVLLESGVFFAVESSVNAIGTLQEPISFRGADASGWGGINFLDTSSNSSLIHCRVEGSTDSGITLASDNAPVIQHCTIIDNLNSGIRRAAGSAPLTLEHCLIANNTASQGGGINYVGDQLTLIDCKISGNSVSGSGALGGGVLALGNCTITNSLICDNVATSDVSCGGGGVYSALARELNISNSVFRNNGALAEPDFDVEGFGGGLACLGDASALASIENSVFTCNTAEQAFFFVNEEGPGGAIHATTMPVELTNCTLVNNSGHGTVWTTTGTLTNCLVYFSTPGFAPLSGANAVTYSNIEGGILGTGNIEVDPILPVPGGCLAVEVFVPAVSPCVDAGNPDPLFDDAAQPPGHLTSRNDMGASGGPGNANWLTGWTDLGYAKAGATSLPNLVGTGTLLAGANTTLNLTNAPANSTAFLIVNSSVQYLAFQQGFIVPDLQAAVLLPRSTDGFGAETLAFPWLGLPSQFPVYFQYWIADSVLNGFAASNAVRAITP